MSNRRTSSAAEPHLYDCIGIGFGPSNMSLAIALEERSLLANCLFLEAQDDFLWHPGMLIPGTDIQHNPLRDLVTPRNPNSPYGFLSYLKTKGRLFDYLNLAAPYPPRTEYAGYIKWVGEKFSSVVRLSSRVFSISYAARQDGSTVLAVATEAGVLNARALSFGTGRSVMVPPEFEGMMDENVVHLTHYLTAKARWSERKTRPRIAVVGGSQSAAEILLDSSKYAQVTGLTRGFGFKHKDLSPFTECIYYPEFVDYFFQAGVAAQNRMMAELWQSNYGAADPDVVAALNMLLYEQKVTGGDGIDLRRNVLIRHVSKGPHGYLLELEERFSGKRDSLEVDGIVLATGYKNFGDLDHQEPYHPLLKDVADDAVIRTDGGIDIARDYRLVCAKPAGMPAIFINGLSESSHGFGDAGSFSLLSFRSDQIASAIEAFLHDHKATRGFEMEPTYYV